VGVGAHHLVLTGLGATVNDTRRIIDGSWRLKFANDSAPVLGFELKGEGVDLYSSSTKVEVIRVICLTGCAAR